jgi:hypothetical protein
MNDSSIGRTGAMKVLITMVTAIALLFAGTVASPQAAHADVAGKYTWVCIASNGSSNTLRSGAALSTCKGSYLKGYISGKQVISIEMTGSGKVATNNFTPECIVATFGGVMKIISTGGVGLLVSVNNAASKQKGACHA